MKKCLAVIMAACLLLHAGGNGQSASSYVSAEGLHALSDIEDHWAKTSIEQAVQKGYVDGYEDGTFRPENNVKRNEFLKMVVTALGIEVNQPGPGDNWYTPYAGAAFHAGIHHWEDFTAGDWETPITRQEMARIAVRAADPDLKDETNDNRLVYEAAKRGLIQGFSGGELALDRSTTRAQSVTVIERILSVKQGMKLEADKYAVSNAEIAWHKTNIFTVMPEFFGKLLPGSSWNPDDLFVETPDGNYRGEMDALIAIDLSDPNDPNLSQLPDIQTLKWYNLGNGKGFPITDYKDSYLLYFKSHTVYNHDTSIYVGDSLRWTILGIEKPDFDAFQKGTLNSIASVIKNKPGDFPAFIIPKKGLVTNELIELNIHAPAIAPNPLYRKTILRAWVPAKID